MEKGIFRDKTPNLLCIKADPRMFLPVISDVNVNKVDSWSELLGDLVSDKYKKEFVEKYCK